MDAYRDDRTILDSADLWRRIHPRQIVPNKDTGELRASSAAFKDHPNGTPMSVLLADVVVESGRDAFSALAKHPGYALAAISAGHARECKQGVAREPLPNEPAHAVVFGNKTKSIQRRLAKGAIWIIPPSDRPVR